MAIEGENFGAEIAEPHAAASIRPERLWRSIDFETLLFPKLAPDTLMEDEYTMLLDGHPQIAVMIACNRLDVPLAVGCNLAWQLDLLSDASGHPGQRTVATDPEGVVGVSIDATHARPRQLVPGRHVNRGANGNLAVLRLHDRVLAGSQDASLRVGGKGQRFMAGGKWSGHDIPPSKPIDARCRRCPDVSLTVF